MSQRVTGFAKKPAPEAVRAAVPIGLLADIDDEPRAIPLELKPLVMPYRSHGRLSVRVERLPHRARLSRGRNNGDRSWSLSLDELDDVKYLAPQGAERIHQLSIRVINLDGGDGATISLFDYPIAYDDEPVEADGTAVHSNPEHGDLRRLRDELSRTKASLADRDAELARARAAAEKARSLWLEDADDALAAAEEAWKADEAARLAEAEARWQEESARALLRARTQTSSERTRTDAAEMRRLRDETNQLKAALGEREIELAQSRAEAKAGAAPDDPAELLSLRGELAKVSTSLAEREAELALARTSAERSKGESGELRRARDEVTKLKTSLAERESELARVRAESQVARTRSDSAELRGVRDELGKAQASVAERDLELTRVRAQAKTDRTRTDSAEVRRLRGELEKVQAILAERERSLAGMQALMEEARTRWQKDTEAALSAIRKTSRAEEAERLAAAESQWKEEAAKTLGEATERFEQAQLSTAMAHAQTKAERDRGHETERRRVAEELAKTKAALAVRDGELAKTRETTEEMRARWQEESEAALSEAESTWKSDEAARFAAAQEVWRQETERVLKVARIEAKAEQVLAGKAEIADLRDELEKMKTDLLEREAAAARAISAAEEKGERSKREAATALAKAQNEWKGAEAARLNAAKADWEASSAKALSQARVQMKADRDREREVEIHRLRDELEKTKSTLALHEMELTLARSKQPQDQSPVELLDLHNAEPGSFRSRSGETGGARRPSHLVRDIALVALLAVVVTVLYPRLAPMISAWLPTDASGPSSLSPPTAGTVMPLPAPPPATVTPAETVTRMANVRESPSTTAALITTLPRLAKVTPLERRGEWVLVSFQDDGDKSSSQKGWVRASLLSGSNDAAKAP